MFKYILILFVLYVPIVNAWVPVVTNHSTPEEEPPIEQCAYQERLHDGLWRCYTHSQWNQKVLSKEQSEKEKQAKIDAWNNTVEGKIIKSIVWVLLSGFVLLILTGIALTVSDRFGNIVMVLGLLVILFVEFLLTKQS